MLQHFAIKETKPKNAEKNVSFFYFCACPCRDSTSTENSNPQPRRLSEV